MTQRLRTELSLPLVSYNAVAWLPFDPRTEHFECSEDCYVQGDVSSILGVWQEFLRQIHILIVFPPYTQLA